MYSSNLISPNDKKGDKKKSNECTELFKKLSVKNNLNPIISKDDSKANKAKGIDAWIDLFNKQVAVDIKSLSNFGDAICFEHQKISGTIGSLFMDFTDYFAIERNDAFYFFDTKELRKRFCQLVDVNSESICTNRKNICWDKINNRYKLYIMLNKSQFNRWWDNKPNNDRFAYVLFSDIEDLVVYKLMKD